MSTAHEKPAEQEEAVPSQPPSAKLDEVSQ